MELISLKYAIFVIALLVLYYCFPKKYRWYVLLAGSMAYYVIICKWYVLFIIFTISKLEEISISSVCGLVFSVTITSLMPALPPN